MKLKKSSSYNELSAKLMEHYRLFNEGFLWLEAYGEESGTCIICCHIYYPISFDKCRLIAKYVKKQIPHHMFSYIYVGPFYFKPNEL
jgi:hypothetical protein